MNTKIYILKRDGKLHPAPSDFKIYEESLCDVFTEDGKPVGILKKIDKTAIVTVCRQGVPLSWLNKENVRFEDVDYEFLYEH